MEDIPAVPFDTGAAGVYGPIRAATREKARDALDRLSAAHAVGLDAALVANNEADFAGYRELKIENWVRG